MFWRKRHEKLFTATFNYVVDLPNGTKIDGTDCLWDLDKDRLSIRISGIQAGYSMIGGTCQITDLKFKEEMHIKIDAIKLDERDVPWDDGWAFIHAWLWPNKSE